MEKASQSCKNATVSQILTFVIPFLLLGIIGWIMQAMDYRGDTAINQGSCGLMFFLFGTTGGLVGLGLRWSLARTTCKKN